MGGRLAAGVISIGVTFEIFFDVIRLMTPGVRAGVGRGVQGVQEAAGVAKGRSVGDVIDHDEGVCPSPVLGQRVRRLQGRRESIFIRFRNQIWQAGHLRSQWSRFRKENET